MSLPVFLHSAMPGAPTLTPENASLNALLNACLVNGFNTQSVASATASGGVVTFNFPSGPGFSALDTVSIAGASNATVNGRFRVQSAASNQVLVPVPGVPDGAVGGTITMRFAPLGWTRPYSGTGVAAYRQGGSASHKRFLRVFDNTVATIGQWFARGYGNMTAISTGTDAFPSTTEFSGNGAPIVSAYNGGDTGPKPWWLVGTPRAFYLVHQYQNTVPTDGDNLAFGFGDLARAAKPGDTYAQFIGVASGFPSQIRLCRNHTGTVNTPSVASLYGAGSQLTYPSPASGGVTFSDAPYLVENVQSGTVLRGYMPGMLSPLEAAPSLLTLANVAGVTGRVAVFRDAYAGSNFAVLLDEDWGDV